MTNAELNQLSLSDLRDLAKRANEMYSLKLRTEGMINAETFKSGMMVVYNGSTPKIKGDLFIIQKINKVNALCKNTRTGENWNLKFANIEKCEPMVEAVLLNCGFERKGEGFQK